MDNPFIVFALPLLSGYLLDLALGDPRWLPHPIRLFGHVIYFGESLFNNGKWRFLKGLLFTLLLCVIVYLVFHFSCLFFFQINIIVYLLFTTLFVFYGLANKSLLQEGKEVFDMLQNNGLEAGRKRLSWIVGRDTTSLSENQIRTAVFETLSENLSDGVVAPLFYYAIGGLPAMMVYKMINTLDSMIGYKNEKYFYFGKFAARLDDVANFIPARLTAFIMILVSAKWSVFSFVYQYRNQHASPNSGYPEAALAGIMNCQFGGPNRYHGQLVQKPFIGNNPRAIQNEEFAKVARINHKVTLVTLIIIITMHFLWFS
jgi:adenosylcobinamide-phosphate synthase